MKITTRDRFRARLHQAGLRLIVAEIVAALLWAAATLSYNPWILMAILVTALATGLCMVDQPKRLVFDAWQDLGQPLASFPVTPAQLELAANWAMKKLRQLAQIRAGTSAEVIHLRTSFHETAEGLNRREVERLIAKIMAAESAAKHADIDYLMGWRFLTHFIAPQILQRFNNAEAFQEWANRETPAYSVR